MASMPAAVADEIANLRVAVAEVVPARQERNLLIATWNLRAFGGLSQKWNSGPNDSPRRDWRAVALIAAVISHFDVVAVQEVRRDLTALRFLIDQLGPDWRFVTSDVTEGDAGNGERLTYLYDASRVQPSGLVGEIVLPPVAGSPVQQFARTPYAMSFQRAGVEFILTTLHVVWGDRPADRLPEITRLAEWMRAWAERPRDLNQNLLVLGDFNLDRLGDPLFDAFVSTGLWPPGELDEVPRTIFDNSKTRHFYDQVAWFLDTEPVPAVPLLTSLEYTHRAGSFNFIPHVFPDLTRTSISWRISDHYPLWVEFDVANDPKPA